MSTVIIAILIFGLIIVVHEYGHFIVARKSGIVVEEFAVGMGPLLFGKKIGDTFYSLRAIPLGGYCKMLGAEEGTEEKEGSFNTKSVYARIAVISAGSIMNILLSFVLVFILLSVDGFISPTVSQTVDGMPAQQAGLLPGDRVVSINNTRIFVFMNAPMALANTAGTPIDIVVNRGGQNMTIVITPIQNEAGNTVIGFYPTAFGGLFGQGLDEMPRAGIFATIQHSVFTIMHYIRALAGGLFQLITFNIALDDLSGPVGIVTMIGDVYEQATPYGAWVAIASLMNFTALISANLALFNLIPIPALDGGRLVFLFIEMVRGKPIAPEKEGMVHLVGIALLLGLILVVTFNDILRLF
ncbi:MAG: RIP metalloprotease RseP [Defluviitaleaceae bacterium]|nr:RIP metalloprotease RseP [Defluviitaleaceae bacterium]